MTFRTTLAFPVSNHYLVRDSLQFCQKMQPFCVPPSTTRFPPVGAALQSPLPPARPSPLPVRRLVASIMSLKSSSFPPPLAPLTDDRFLKTRPPQRSGSGICSDIRYLRRKSLLSPVSQDSRRVYPRLRASWYSVCHRYVGQLCIGSFKPAFSHSFAQKRRLLAWCRDPSRIRCAVY